MSPRERIHGELAESEGGQFSPSGYWRSLEEIVDTEVFNEMVRQEFPALADVWPTALSRRKFLSLMGASLALAGAGGCSTRPAPSGELVPYAKSAEPISPGSPLYYATTMVHDGDAVGLLVESREGRPTKIEGNPSHPASLGATSAFHQASVLSLYDSNRSQSVTCNGKTSTWNDAETAIASVLDAQKSKQGAGLCLLTEPVVSPTLQHQVDRLLEQFPQAAWHTYAPVESDVDQRAGEIAFGERLQPRYDFASADVVLSLDVDFLTQGPGHLKHARDFMQLRSLIDKPATNNSEVMNRLYVAEPCVTCTGAKADHRIAVRMQELPDVARSLAHHLGVTGVAAPEMKSHLAKWITTVAQDLRLQGGRSLVVAGYRQPVEVHVLVHLINEHLGSIGKTVQYYSVPASSTASLEDLIADVDSGKTEVIFILGANPVFTAPANLDLASRVAKVSQSFHLSLYDDETSETCTWHLPQKHFLESWSDARAFDGTASLVQPLIKPLYAGRSDHEIVALMSGEGGRTDQDLVKCYWNERWEQQDDTRGRFEELWQTALHDGAIHQPAPSPVSVEVQSDWQSAIEDSRATSKESEGLELVFAPDPTIYDGRYALNGWLQELPKPISKLTWDNAALMSPMTARRLNLDYRSFAHGGEHGGYHVPVVTLQLNDRKVEAPVWIMPGHADDSVTVYLGHGRTCASRILGEAQRTLGFDAYQLRTSSNQWYASGLQVSPTKKSYPLACTQSHHSMEGHDLVRSTSWQEFQNSPGKAVEDKREREEKRGDRVEPPLSLYERYDYSPPLHKWAMSINTTACTGCNACVVACQAENNIPVVGKEQVTMGREMHWIRIDRYARGDLNEPDEFHLQPVTCMHCEQAPCEYVCPVAATVHNADGLNDMIYNRCVGTRFCSNNCPYKVRRFNFLQYSDYDEASPRSLQYNPDVTVRTRGVMEKCTYCVQRIRRAETEAQAANRPLHDGEVVTACQAACPTRAIAFGDANDTESEVSQWRDSPLAFGLLTELNTLPRTTYLAAVRNPNPELEAE